MKKLSLFLALAVWGLTLQAQTDVRAQIIIPPGLQYTRVQENQLQVQLTGFNGNEEYLRTRTVDVNTVPGVLQFNLILDDNNEDGYFDLRYAASSKNEFETMLREIFCRLDIRSILVNDTAFEGCRSVTVPEE